eukprot:12898807-Prorocentrum_lima.AAC.1
MDCTGPTCPACGDGEVDQDLPSSPLPFSTSPFMDCGGMDGRLDGCLDYIDLAILILLALSEPYTCYSTNTSLHLLLVLCG